MTSPRPSPPSHSSHDVARERRLALIVGAGIGGLAAGLALRRAGWDIRIFERAATPRELGFGLGLAPNAIAALRELGIADAVVPRRTMSGPVSAEIRYTDGRLLRRFTIAAERLNGVDTTAVILRPVLHNALLDAVGPDALTLGREAIGFQVEDQRPVLRLADGTTASGDILVGADGIHSAIRAQLHPAEAAPAPSGHCALRGASTAMDALDGLQFLGYVGHGIESGIIPASEDRIYWYVGMLADDLGGGSQDPWELLRWRTDGFDPQFKAIANATAPGDLRFDELLVRRPLDRWGIGPVTLLGDAAHPMLPHTGQGAAQALEDAVALGLALAPPGDPIAALRRYERVRAAWTRRVVAMGPRIAAVTTTRNPLITAVRNTAIHFMPTAAIVKLAQAKPRDPHRELRRGAS